MPARSSSFEAVAGSARLARGLSPPISGESESATDSLTLIFVAAAAAGASNSPGSAWTSRSAAKTRSSGTAVPFSPLNVAELSCIHLPGFSPSGAYSSAVGYASSQSGCTIAFEVDGEKALVEYTSLGKGKGGAAALLRELHQRADELLGRDDLHAHIRLR